MKNIDVSNFIRNNYSEYLGDSSFLKGPTTRTLSLLEQIKKLLTEENNRKGVYSIDTSKILTINSHDAGYIDKSLELIYGLQTEKPLERGINPFGGMRLVESACIDEQKMTIHDNVYVAMQHIKTHNELVFEMYTEEMKVARKIGLLTGLPDSYGRGRLIGDYRRVSLYGTHYLIEEKYEQFARYNDLADYKHLQYRKEILMQINSLKELEKMCLKYDNYNITQPATNSREAIQHLYFAYLAAIKEQNGAAMSLGRISTFLDIYLEKDLQEGKITEIEAQELIDDFILKLRVARHLRTAEYNTLFAGDPMWITEAVGGMQIDGKKSFVTKTSYRFLNTLYNLGPAPEPNLTVLWSESLPIHFKEFCARVSIDTASIQYENDELIRQNGFGDDYGISCCVSAMKLGKEMQYFGARVNLPKLLLIAINGGVDVSSETLIGPQMGVLSVSEFGFSAVNFRLKIYLEWLSRLYADTMNLIHFSHDITCYEKMQMALHDIEIQRDMSFGLAGLSVLTDSLSAIKHNCVIPLKNSKGLIENFEITGDFPMFGNDDPRVDEIATEQVSNFIKELRKHSLYRGARPTLSILTITSNVMYGQKTGATPDGRGAGEPFAPGANPMNGREKNGLLASLNSVSKLNYSDCLDGISNTVSIVPTSLGSSIVEQTNNLIDILDGYFKQGGYHLNINVMNKTLLIHAYNYPEKYPNLTIRVSGYAVHFVKLTREHQQEIIERAFHEVL